MVTVTVSGKLPAGLSHADVTKLVSLTLARVGKKGSVSLSVRTVTDAAIRKLNLQHRGKDKVTDVLSFSATEGLPKVMREAAGGELGDLIIATAQVRRQAKEIGRTTTAEFALMVVHGTLHLLGYDHVSVADETKMFGLQQDVLMKAGIL